MRKFLIGAMLMALGASSLAGQPPPPNPPPKVTVNPTVSNNLGVQTDAEIQVGPVAIANTSAVKLNSTVAASLSATAGWVP